ncbi:MAG: hypothetical protein ACP5HQ_06400 [Thermoprotei archaeon]
MPLQRITIGFSEQIEAETIKTVFDAIKDEYEVSLTYFPEEKLKFEIHNVNLAFVPSSFMFLVEGMKALTSLAQVDSKLELYDLGNRIYGVKHSWDIEYYVARAMKYTVRVGTVSQQRIDVTEHWSQRCDSVPIVRKVLATTNTSDEDVRRLKASIRKALTKVQLPSPFVKELGKHSTEFVNCLRNIMEESGVPIVSQPVLY